MTLNAWFDAYNDARAEHAYQLRMSGHTYREIGERLGVGAVQARTLARVGERHRRFAKMHEGKQAKGGG